MNDPLLSDLRGASRVAWLQDFLAGVTMQSHEEPGIGDRIARLRMRRKLTQEGLAERAGLSVDVVRKLEQGVRQTARLTTLNALARALDVEPSTLVGQPATFEVRDEEDQPSVLAL